MPKPTLFEVIKSVFSAFIGVQSDTNRQKDFTQGSLKMYLIVGAAFTIAFIASLIFVVSAVIG